MNIAAADFETDPFALGRTADLIHPFCAGFFDGKLYRAWWGKDCVKELVKAARKFQGYVYFHNGGKFDFRFLLRYLPASVKIHAVKGRVAKIKWGACEFRDSYLLLPVPLAAFEKEKFDYRKLEAAVREKHRPEIMRYLKSDCQNLHSFVTQFIEEHGFGLTLAGRTFAILKKQFDLDPPKMSERHDTKFRPFYYGGRVQFMGLGKLPGPWRVIDINSAYPRAMLDRHWFGPEYTVTSRLPRNRKKLETAFISFTGQGGGALPWRNPDGGVIYPMDRREFFVTGWEFLAARETGVLKVEKINRIYLPDDCRDFSRYVNFYYKAKARAKAAGDPVQELFNKLLLNSLYGRFALNPREFKDVQLANFGDMAPLKDGWEIARDFEDCGLTLWEKKTTVRHNSFFNVCTAASITGWVRAFLWRSICQVKGPIYCDTDSIICRGTGKLKIGKNLGDWKLEGTGPTIWIAGKKLYAMRLHRKWWKRNKAGKMVEWKTAAKGVRLAPRQICACAGGKTVKMVFIAPSFSWFGNDRITSRRVRRDDLRKLPLPTAAK